MNLLTVAAAALNQTPMDWGGNLHRILGALREARGRGAAVLCLPELCTSGYGCEDALASADLRRRCWGIVAEVAPHTRGMAVCLGLPLLHRNGLFNAAALLVDGRLAGLAAKRHLAGEGLHYEPRWFKPWPGGVRTPVATPMGEVPMGDLLFDVSGVRIGFEICEDAWVAERPGARLAAMGVDLILNPSASHFSFGKSAVRERFVLEGSRAFGATYIYANLLGNEAGRAIYDGGVIIASGGELVARGDRFGMGDWAVTTAVVDLDRQRTAQARTASFTPEVRDDGTTVLAPVAGGGLAPAPAPERAVVRRAGWEVGPAVKEEEFTRAVCLGLLDYLRKSRSRGFVVSLSGGADSAGTAALVRCMVGLAERELGAEGLARKLAGLTPPGNTAVSSLLTTVYQSAEGSGESSRAAARAVAAAVGSAHHEFDVGPLVSGFVALAENAVGRRLTWERDDLALQNIQARARGPGAWLLANLSGSLLLTTSNRSEAAVGYATMDGDTCGGLAPLAGIDKAFLLRWLRWLAESGPEGVGPIPGLAAVLARRPSPELRPASMGQTSEGDLMPYEVLEAIEEGAVTAKQSPAEVERSLAAAFPASTRADRVAWITRFFTLWCRNQWKRERYAPGFHVDDHSLDPRTWCRFPILSGGFAAELAELAGGA